MNNLQRREQEYWRPQGWRTMEQRCVPPYAGQEVAAVTGRLSELPGLVGAEEVRRLKAELGAVAEGRAFVLQMGDTDERFRESSPRNVRARMATLGSMSNYVGFMLDKPVISIALAAGSYAQTPLRATEIVDGVSVTSYYGEMVNDPSPHPWGRTPDARRMLWAYEAAQATLATMRQCGLRVFTSHQVANLLFEEALVRRCSSTASYHAASAHLLWLAAEHLRAGSAYLEFLRGVDNPIGVRVGPELSASELLSIYMALNPRKEAGKIVVMTSLGSQLEPLREFVRVFQGAHAPVVWMSAPVHADSRARSFEAAMAEVSAEVERTASAHMAEGSRLGGLHIESSRRALAGGDADERDPAAAEGGRLFEKTLQVCSKVAHVCARTQ
ncbi:3-deoxy-7-phosphoheptulonate synthase [Sorangium sp. So ce302]|uniref:3-deoxy-7-phosphoheptulonate synthase n=1 Tax=Sorangium sp. So ce302 TaxID=3133297 RepID=UPI003F60CE26